MPSVAAHICAGNWFLPHHYTVCRREYVTVRLIKWYRPCLGHVYAIYIDYGHRQQFLDLGWVTNQIFSASFLPSFFPNYVNTCWVLNITCIFSHRAPPYLSIVKPVASKRDLNHNSTKSELYQMDNLTGGTLVPLTLGPYSCLRKPKLACQHLWRETLCCRQHEAERELIS